MRGLLLLLAALCSLRSVGAPLDAYGRLPFIERGALSPDGSKIALVQTRDSRHLIVILDIGSETMIGLSRIGDEKVRSLEWADDDHLLLTSASTTMPMQLSGEKAEWHLMQVYSLQSKKWTPLLNRVVGRTTTMNVVYGRPTVVRTMKETLLYVHGVYVTDKTQTALFRINLTTGIESLVKQGGSATIAWLVDDSGEIVAEQDYVESDHRWAIRLYAGGRSQHTASGIAAIDPPALLGLSGSGDSIIVASRESQGVVWKPLIIKDGTWGPEIAPDEALTGLVLREGSQRMVGTAFIGDETRYHFADPALQAGWDWTVRVFGYQRVELISVSADHSKLLVEVQGPKSGYAYFYSDTKEHLTKPLGAIYEGVAQMAEVRPIKYPSTDGLEIPAYLTLPPDRPAKNLPVVVFPHGGPEAHDTLGFDWWAQALAAQGYAVLQPNYRGSDLNEKWIEAGYGEWGRKMQTDLSDGLTYLAAQGVVDAGRACIVGASYGGYAALAGVTLQSGIYRCAVAVAAVSDPSNFMRWVVRKESFGDKIGQRYWARFLGVDDPKDKRLDEISPLKHVDRLAVPLLLIHGREDTTVPFDQSADVVKAAKKIGRPVELVTLDNEDHYLSRSATRLQMLQASMVFLQKYNPAN